MELRIEPAYNRPREIARLFTEYTDGIAAEGAEVARCLAAQHYEDEVRDLRKKYGPPDGRLYLARLDDCAAGCVALRRLDGACCEMKRLYVRPQFRGSRVGAALVERVIADASAAGYGHMRLDTFPFMDSAVRMYRRYGFYEIARYNDNPAPSAIFMQLDL